LNKHNDKPTVLELIEQLENEVKLYREDINSLDIEDCLKWVEDIVDEFNVRLFKCK